jgi:hypothetical protein
MSSKRRQSLIRRVPAWLIILTALMTASVIAARVQAATVSPDPDGAERHLKSSRLVSGRAVAFALTFDHIASRSGSRLTLFTPTGDTRAIPVRLVARPNTLHASFGTSRAW